MPVRGMQPSAQIFSLVKQEDCLGTRDTPGLRDGGRGTAKRGVLCWPFAWTREYGDSSRRSDETARHLVCERILLDLVLTISQRTSELPKRPNECAGVCVAVLYPAAQGADLTCAIDFVKNHQRPPACCSTHRALDPELCAVLSRTRLTAAQATWLAKRYSRLGLLGYPLQLWRICEAFESFQCRLPASSGEALITRMRGADPTHTLWGSGRCSDEHAAPMAIQSEMDVSLCVSSIAMVSRLKKNRNGHQAPFRSGSWYHQNDSSFDEGVDGAERNLEETGQSVVETSSHVLRSSNCAKAFASLKQVERVASSEH